MNVHEFLENGSIWWKILILVSCVVAFFLFCFILFCRSMVKESEREPDEKDDSQMEDLD